ncbi:retrotransposon protein, putative, ty3-gypsy subclass [Tanacetum coccineum]
MEASFKKHIDSLLKLEVIRPSNTRHRTMAMMVNSGTSIDPATGAEVKGKERMVFNYRSLNDNTYKDQYSLPGINTIIQKVRNAKVFSKFDLKSGFHQVAMEEESIPWTAFLAPGGLYEWLVMPFGLKNAPAIFQRKMDKCFKGMEAFIAVYIDDILVFSKNEEEHAKHLSKMLKTCKDNGLVLSPTKMKIAVPRIDFLGVVIGEGRIHLQPHIIKKIVEFDEESMKTKKGLRSFLGILNYARQHIPRLGILLRPLYEKTNAHGDKRLKLSDYQIIREIAERWRPHKELPEKSKICTHDWKENPVTWRSTRLTPPAPVLTVDKADEMILQDTLQVSLAEHKSREEQEARENVKLVNKHLASEEIEKMVDEPKNVIDDSPIPRNDDHNIPGTREKGKIVEESRSTPSPTPIRSPRIHTDLESTDTEKLQELTETNTTPSSSSLNTKLSTTNRLLSLFKAKPARFKHYKSFFQELQGRYGYLFEHLKAKFLSRKSFDTLADHLQEVMVESLPTMVDKHIKEQVEKQVPEQVKVQVPVYVAKGLLLERQQNKEETDKMIAKAMLQERGRLQAEISSQIQQAIDNHIPSLVDESVRNYMSGHILHVHPAQPQTTSVPEQQYQLYLSMKNNPQLQQQDIAIWLALQMKFETLQVPQTTCRTSAVRPRDQDDPHDDAPPEGENSAKRQKTSEYEAYVTRESSGQTGSYASDDDEIPTKQVLQDIMKEVSLTINEAELKKIADEMLRQRCC